MNAVGGGEGAGHPGGHTAGEVHRNGPQTVLFIGPAGLVKELLGLRRALRTGAEHGLAVAAPPIGVGKAGAGEGLLQLRELCGGGLAALLQQPGVDPGDYGHVLRPLHPALQLQAGDTHLRHLAQVPGKAAILQAQGVLAPGGAVHAVGQAAGLGAAAPVAGAAADQGAHGALAGIAHAQRPVDKDLHLHRAVAADGGGVLLGALPGDDHPLTAVLGQFHRAAGGKDAHLGAGVEGLVRQGPAQQVEKAPVLDQNGVHAQAAGGSGGLQRRRQLPVRDQGIEGEKHPGVPFMTVAQGLGEFLVGEILGAPAGVELPPAQIHGPRAVLHRRPEGLRGPGGREQFRLHPCFSLFCRCSSFC